MQPETAAITRLPMPSLTKIDGRSSPARRMKTVAERLKREINAGRRWSNSELDLLRRTASLIVLAEESTRRAISGALAVSDAIKAGGLARRSERDLRVTLERNLAEPVLGPDSLRRYAEQMHGYKP